MNLRYRHRKLDKKRIIFKIINSKNNTLIVEQESKGNCKVLNGPSEKFHEIIIMQCLGIDIAIIHDIVLGKWECARQVPRQEMRVVSLGQEDLLEKETATQSSILAWEAPGTEEPGGLQFTGLQRVGHDSVTENEKTHKELLPCRVKSKSLSEL